MPWWSGTNGPEVESSAAARVPLGGHAGRRVVAHRAQMLETLRRHGVTRPEIFGSTARGDELVGSDVDVLVDLPDGMSLLDLIGIQRQLEDLLGVPVDLVPRGERPALNPISRGVPSPVCAMCVRIVSSERASGTGSSRWNRVRDVHDVHGSARGKCISAAARPASLAVIEHPSCDHLVRHKGAGAGVSVEGC